MDLLRDRIQFPALSAVGVYPNSRLKAQAELRSIAESTQLRDLSDAVIAIRICQGQMGVKKSPALNIRMTPPNGSKRR